MRQLKKSILKFKKLCSQVLEDFSPNPPELIKNHFVFNKTIFEITYSNFLIESITKFFEVNHYKTLINN
ncbi:MAG: hypothetical protein C0490_24155 [Marivirga sp.]|nr:hypothetical protein [Marivirga sp.]